MDPVVNRRGFAQRIGQKVPNRLGRCPENRLDPGKLRSPNRSQSVTAARAALSFVLGRRLGYRVAAAAALDRDVTHCQRHCVAPGGPSRLSDHIAADVARLSRNV